LFIQSLHSMDGAVIGRYLDAISVENSWMAPWLTMYEGKYSAGKPQKPIVGGAGHAEEDEDGPADVNDDVFDDDRLSDFGDRASDGDNNAFDKLSSFSGGDDGGSPMGSSP
jgi:hypothetical protein